MQWYALHDTVVPFLGRRATTLFVHAISAQTDCLICSTFFRRLLIEAGENPDQLVLDEREAALVGLWPATGERRQWCFRRAVSVAWPRALSPEQLVALTAFGGMMIATNVFNNALRVDLDDYLQPYRKPESWANAQAAR